MSTAKHSDSTLYLVGFRYDEMTGDRIMLTKPVPVGMTTDSLDGGETVINFVDSEDGFSPVRMLDIPDNASYFGVFDTMEDRFGPHLLVRFERDIFTTSEVGVGVATVGVGTAVAHIQIRSIP